MQRRRLQLPSSAAREMPPTPCAREALRGPLNDLHLAAGAGSTKRTLAALSTGSIDVNRGDLQRRTPLMAGAFDGFSQVVEILLNAGADVSLVNHRGTSALSMSCLTGHLSTTYLLLRAGADPDAPDCEGFTPLHAAAAGRHYKVLAALIEAGANPDPRFRLDGCTPLHIAATEGDVECVRVLLRANANALLPRTSSGFTFVPSDTAVHRGHTGVTRELLQRLGIEGCGGRYGGIYGLFVSTSMGRCFPRIARLLVDAGMDTKSPVRISYAQAGEINHGTLLAWTNQALREKKFVDGRDATEGQLNRLEGIRRLLLQVDAVHAISWLWPTNPAFIALAAGPARKSEAVSTPLRTMLPIPRLGVILGPVCR